MADLVQHPVVSALAWALVHFVWQGAAIALAAIVAFRLVRTSASWRYAIGVGALAAMLAAPIATFVTLLNAPMPLLAVATQDQATAASSTLGEFAARTGTSATATAPMPALVLSPQALAAAVSAWLAGVAFFTLRLIGGWVVARRIAKTSVRPAAAHLQALASRVADRLALRRVVAVVESSVVAVPVIVGWLKPTIVLPVAALAGLSPAQVEALLAHELAHVRRHDYLVNLLQSLTEAILFYHPAVWWLSRRVRMERELCCDDLAVGVCDRFVYVTALTDLAAMTSSHVALAATDGDLLGRVRRILSHSETHADIRGSIMSGLTFGLVATVAIPVALISATQTTTAPEQAQAIHRAHGAPVAHAATQGDHARPAAAVHAQTHAQGTHPDQTAGQTAQTAAQAEEKRREELQRLMADIKKHLAQLELQRVEAARVQLTEAHKQRVAEVMVEAEKVRAAHGELANAVHAQTAVTAATAAELDAARRKLEDARQMFEKGLMSRSQLLEAEAALATLQAKGNAAAMATRELQQAREKLARSRTLVEKGLKSQRDLAELEAQVANLEQRQLAQKVQQAQAASQSAKAREVHALLADLELRVAEQVPDTIIGGEEQVRAGDIVRVGIEGEPSLPPTYRVSADGTIRIPFLGSIKVVGLNTAQVRAAVGNQLSARKLGSPSQVKVTVSRPGGHAK